MVAKCSVFLKNKNFNDITKEDLLSYLQSLRRDERKDPTHKWVGMHNSHLITLKRFFKWLYYPEIEAKKRQCPIIFNGITKFKRREISGYSPEGMWTAEDTLLFLRYCISARNKCYVAMALDTAWRPSEGLRLRSRDITIEHNSEGKKYAEIFIRTGKTGARSIPLTDSMPWVKEWEQQHPQSCNRESIFLCGFDKSRGKKLTTLALNVIYKHYKKEYFPGPIEYRYSKRG
jgi:integrase